MTIIKLLYEMSKEERMWLNLMVTHFNLNYNTYPKYTSIFDEMRGLVDFSCPKELWSIITNTARALRYNAKGFMFPRHKDVYKDNKQKISHHRMIKLVDHLVEKGYLTYYQGGVVSFKNDEVVSSILVFNKCYLDLWESVTLHKEEDVLEPVQLRDRLTKESIALEGRANPLIKAMRRYNNVLTTVNISLDGALLPVQQYKRVFNGSLKAGGRYYNTIGGIQTMSEQTRSRLHINNEPTVELDFKALHPSILYDQLYQKQPALVEAWLEMPYDPYRMEVDFIPIDQEKVQYIRDNFKPNYNPLRALVKSAMLVGLNAGDIKSAYLSVANMLYEDKRKYWEKSPEKAKYYGVVIERDADGGSRFPAKLLCELVQVEHSPIAEHFFSDKGVELQYLDSEIISLVLTNLMEDNEILLSEHDSIIVRSSLADRAEQLMRSAYKSVVGSDKFCILERK